MFSINLSSPEPIYNQIIHQIKRLLDTGDLKGGDSLPPIRSLASQLDISINTVARAYRELESEGFLESNGRRGSFIRHEWDHDLKGDIFSRDIGKLITAGLSRDQIIDLFNKELLKQTGE